MIWPLFGQMAKGWTSPSSKAVFSFPHQLLILEYWRIISYDTNVGSLICHPGNGRVYIRPLRTLLGSLFFLLHTILFLHKQSLAFLRLFPCSYLFISFLLSHLRLGALPTNSSIFAIYYFTRSPPSKHTSFIPNQRRIKSTPWSLPPSLSLPALPPWSPPHLNMINNSCAQRQIRWQSQTFTGQCRSWLWQNPTDQCRP